MTAAPARWVPTDRQLAAIAGVALAVLVVAWVNRPVTYGYDTPALVRGADTAVHCIGDLDLRRCGTLPRPAHGELLGTNEERMSTVGPWPPAQYLPAGVVVALGGDEAAGLRALSLVNVAALAAAGVLGWQALRRRLSAPTALVVGLVIALGPLLAYAPTTWGEPLAVAAHVALVSTVLCRRAPWLVAAAAFLTGLTKELAAPAAFLLVLAAVLAGGERGARSVARRAAPAAIGFVAAFVASTAFNVFRFGSLVNDYYLLPDFRVPEERFGHLVALLVSPNGGLVWWWPLAVALGLAAAGSAIVAARRRAPGAGPVVAVVLLAALALGIHLVPLSESFQPFGWWAWGPRLTLPIVPALVGVLAIGSAPHLERLLRSAGIRRGVLGIALLLAVPHIGSVWMPDSAIPAFLRRPASCADPAIRLGNEAYERCLQDQTWSADLMLAEGFTPFGEEAGPWLGVLAVGAAVAAASVRAERLGSAMMDG